MKIVITPSALHDLDEAAEFYENQEPGLGSVCYAFLESEIDSLLKWARIHPQKHGLYYHIVRRRFPYYTIFYRLVEDVIEVSAVLDGRRDPDFNRRKLLDS